MKVVDSYQRVIQQGQPANSTKSGPTLKEQQDYYHALLQKGIARPDIYNIKPLSSLS